MAARSIPYTRVKIYNLPPQQGQRPSLLRGTPAQHEGSGFSFTLFSICFLLLFFSTSLVNSSNAFIITTFNNINLSYADVCLVDLSLITPDLFYRPAPQAVKPIYDFLCRDPRAFARQLIPSICSFVNHALLAYHYPAIDAPVTQQAAALFLQSTVVNSIENI